MATLEDKILGEKLEYYCSSDEEEAESDDEKYSDAIDHPSVEAPTAPSGPPGHLSETTSNTGPKGVIKDWQRYKQLEAEKREEQEKERIKLAQKLSLTCRSTLDEDAEDPELADLLSDQILLEFAQKRMQELLSQTAPERKFGKVFHLRNGDEYLDAIDKELKTVIVILHVYEDSKPSCRTMNACLDELSQYYPCVKFCKMSASAAGLSHSFKVEGVPALLVYKAGDLIGNFIQLRDEFGVDFTANDVENFLVEKGIVLDYNSAPK